MDGIGRYEVIRELGSGGMGQVFLARDPELERLVALKLLHANKAGLVSLREEARALAALSHPHIVTIYEIGQHEARPFIAMEYVDGRPLQQLLQHAARRPSRDELVAICAKVTRALAAAHAAGILHRDIKPENVLVGDAGQVKVVDFGIAQRLAAAPTAPRMTASERAVAVVSELAATQPLDPTLVSAATRTLFGTPAYMAPEVLMGEASSEASDVYSLGVVLYECLAGRRPHGAANLVEVIALVIDGGPIDRIADPLWDLIARMLAAAPAARPGLAEIVERLGAQPPRRRRFAPLAAGSLATVLVLGGGYAVWHRRDTAAPATPAAPAVPPTSIAVEELKITLPSYGAHGPDGRTVGDVLARVLGYAPGISALGPMQLAAENRDPKTAARDLHARYVVRGSIVEVAGKVEARIELVDLAGGAQTVTASAPHVGELATLTRQLADAVAARAHPGARVAAVPDRVHARELVGLGHAKLNGGDWFAARPYYEQAAERDPSLLDAWSGVSSTAGWTIAPEPVQQAAFARTAAVAPIGAQKQLWIGAGQMLSGEFAQAVATLLPLADSSALDANDRRNLAYWLGEALWHDGQHRRAMASLSRVLELAPHFYPAAVHASSYALGTRDRTAAERLGGEAGAPHDRIDFAFGDYETVIRRGSEPDYRLYATLVLRRTPDPALERRTPPYRIARAAGAGDRARARAIFVETWPALAVAPLTEALQSQLSDLLLVLVTAGLVPEAQRVLDALARGATGRFRHTVKRHAILIAGLEGVPRTFERAGTTTRVAQLATAIEAELAGDRARAVELLRAMISDPSDYWDYPERMALLRNLEALDRSTEARALCRDTALRPAIPRDEMLPAQYACRRYLSARPSR